MMMMSNIKADVVNELHKPARRVFKRRHVSIKGLKDLYQADLIELQPYAKFNKGYRYILMVINAFSKFVWASPLKSKSAKDVTAAMEKILINSSPKNLQTDRGKEFFNQNFRKLMQTFDINHYSTFSNMKASIVERVNRTIKNKMWKRFSMQGNYRWLNILPEIVAEYNNTKHSVTGFKPKDVTKKNEKHLLSTVFNQIKTLGPSKFKVGDFVRISKYREMFSKGYLASWSNEIFVIKKVKVTNPATYILHDQKGEEIQGGFYNEELQKVKHPDVYLVEKVLRRKGNKVYVKWLGLEKSHNSWISKNEIL